MEGARKEAVSVGARVGSYRIIRPIAEGGMGAVYEAEHTITRQRRALKMEAIFEKREFAILRSAG